MSRVQESRCISLRWRMSIVLSLFAIVILEYTEDLKITNLNCIEKCDVS
jgi:hypothetical protein